MDLDSIDGIVEHPHDSPQLRAECQVASHIDMSMAETPRELNRLAVVVRVPRSATNLLMARLPKT